MPQQNLQQSSNSSSNSINSKTPVTTPNNNIRSPLPIEDATTISTDLLVRCQKQMVQGNLNPAISKALAQHHETSMKLFSQFNNSTDAIANNLNQVSSTFIDSVSAQITEDEKAYQIYKCMKDIMGSVKNFKSDAAQYNALLPILFSYSQKISPSILFLEVMQINPKLATYLREKKTAMQVAIDNNDLDVIASILFKQPNRSEEKIFYLGEFCSELSYAIATGKVAAVEGFLQIAQTFGTVDLGKYPFFDPIYKVKYNERRLQKLTPAEQELRDHYHIDLDLVTLRNCKRILQTLLHTLPKNETVINTFYTEKEYPIFKYLIAAVEKRKLTPLLIRRYRKKQFIARLEKESKSDGLLRADLADILAAKETAIAQYESNEYWEERKALFTTLYISPSSPAARYINKHVTNAYETIISGSKKLESCGQLIAKKIVAPKRNFVFDFFNIFFSHSSPLTYITPYRWTSSHIVEVDILAAIADGIIDRDHLLVGPHNSAYEREGINPPIMFVGKNPNYKIIWRVFHKTHPTLSQRKKIYRYDFYDGTKFIDSSVDEKLITQEVTRGDNVKTSSWKFLLQLRKFMGPFVKDDYRDYLLEEFAHANYVAVEAARAAFFNVFTEESKLMADLPLTNDAIKIVENPLVKKIKPLQNDDRQILLTAVAKNDLAAIKELITTRGIYKEQLHAVVLKAIELLKIDIVEFLLDFGVNISLDGAALRTVFSALIRSYFAFKAGEDLTSFEDAKKILTLLLYVGSADENDPKHIRHVAELDNCSGKRTVNLTADREADLHHLLEVLILIDDDFVRETIINSTQIHLEDIFKIALIHQYDAILLRAIERVSSGIARLAEPLKKLMLSDDTHDITEIEKLVETCSAKSLLQFQLLTYAIKIGDKVSVQKYFLACKDSSYFKWYFPVHRAVEYGQPAIAQLLLDLQNDARENFCDETVYETAIRCKDQATMARLHAKGRVSVDEIEYIFVCRTLNVLPTIVQGMYSSQYDDFIRTVISRKDRPVIAELINYYETCNQQNRDNPLECTQLFNSLIQQCADNDENVLLEDIFNLIMCAKNRLIFLDLIYGISRVGASFQSKIKDFIAHILELAQPEYEEHKTSESSEKRKLPSSSFIKKDNSTDAENVQFWKKRKTTEYENVSSLKLNIRGHQ